MTASIIWICVKKMSIGHGNMELPVLLLRAGQLSELESQTLLWKTMLGRIPVEDF